MGHFIIRVDPPILTALTPNTGLPNSSVVLTGQHFGPAQENTVLTLNGVGVTVTAWADNSVTFTVPGIVTAGARAVVMIRGGVTSNTLIYTVTSPPPPTIVSLSVSSGPVGTPVTITGTNFGATQGSSLAFFNGVPATSYPAWSATSITTAVPAGATTGSVTVVVLGVTSNGLTFTVTAGSGVQITNTAGALTNGSTLTITGLNFGTKSTAAPLGNDFSDSGSVPAWLTQTPGVPAVGQVSLTNTDNLRTSFVTKNWRLDFKKMSGDGFGGAFYTVNASDASTWYAQYWIKMASNWHWGTTGNGGAGPDDGLANVKWFRLFPNGPTYPNLGISNHSYDGTDFVFVEHNSGATETDYNPAWMLSDQSLNTWHLVQVQTKESTSNNNANGVFKLWFDGTLRANFTNVITAYAADGGFPQNKRPYILGFFDSWPPSAAAVANMFAYMQGIYVDNTWSRVEIGNASTYDTCTHREIQPPTAWSSTSINVTLNQGSFGTLTGTFLYVVDSTGAVNASGFAL